MRGMMGMHLFYASGLADKEEQHSLSFLFQFYRLGGIRGYFPVFLPHFEHPIAIFNFAHKHLPSSVPFTVTNADISSRFLAGSILSYSFKLRSYIYEPCLLCSISAFFLKALVPACYKRSQIFLFEENLISSCLAASISLALSIHYQVVKLHDLFIVITW